MYACCAVTRLASICCRATFVSLMPCCTYLVGHEVVVFLVVVLGFSGQEQSTDKPHPIDVSDKADPKKLKYPWDQFSGKTYRIFEGTVLEGVVTNHIDGALAGPILIMLTTNYYSHDHQQLLMPQGTRLIGTVQSVSGQGQRKLMVTFHRAVTPDGFSLDLDKYAGLDPIGTSFAGFDE